MSHDIFNKHYITDFEQLKDEFLSLSLDNLILLDSNHTHQYARILGAVIRLKQQEADLERIIESADAEVARFLEE